MTATFMYLHGFASSPDGTKVSYLRERFAAQGHTLRAPDLNVPSFETLTVTAMIEAIAREVAAAPDGPVYLIGSSLGGFAAVHFLDHHRGGAGERVTRLALLAPAFDFGRRIQMKFSARELVQWRADGVFPIAHYAVEREIPVHYGFIEDAATFSPGLDLALDLPILILHGQHDDVVPVELSEQFTAQHEHTTLHVLDSDHGMTDKVDIIWRDLEAFFDL